MSCSRSPHAYWIEQCVAVTPSGVYGFLNADVGCKADGVCLLPPKASGNSRVEQRVKGNCFYESH